MNLGADRRCLLVDDLLGDDLLVDDLLGDDPRADDGWPATCGWTTG